MSKKVSVQTPPQPKGATASLVLGILSLLIPLIGLVLGIIAIILGNRARKQPNGGLGTAGFVLGILGTVLGAIWIIPAILVIGYLFTATNLPKPAIMPLPSHFHQTGLIAGE